MPVYDQQQGGYKMPPRRKKDDRYYTQEEEEARKGQQAKSLLEQERMEAAGKGALIGKNSGDDEDLAADGAPMPAEASEGQRENLRALEDQQQNENWFKSEADGGAAGSGTSRLGKAGGIVKSVARKQRNLWAIGLISSMIGGGWMFVLLAIMSGPLQFIHMGRSVEQFHMSVQEAQTGAMALKLARNIRLVANGDRFKTNMSYVGNKYADRIDNSMKEKGISPDYRDGFFRGYIIDPAKTTASDHPGMRDNSPESIQKYYSERFNVQATIVDGKVNLPNTGRYLSDTRLVYATMRSAKFGVLTPVNVHIAKKRIGFTLNPMGYWIRDKDNKILSAAEKKIKFNKEQRQYVKNGVKPPTVTIDSGKDADGNNTNGGDANDATEIGDEAKDTSDAINAGDDSKINQFRSSIHAKLIGSVSAAVGVLCFAKAIATQYDIFTQQSIIQPLERISMQAMSWGSANEDGGSDYVDADLNNIMGERLCNDDGCWNDAREVQHSFGRAESGPKMPEDAEVSPNGNFLTRFLNAIPGLDKVCSTAGQWAITIIGTVIAGPISTFISVIVGVVTGPLFEKFVDWIISTFLAEQINTEAAGPLLGSYAWKGSLYTANDVGGGSGGNPLTEAESTQLRNDSSAVLADDFNHQSLAYRLFDSKDPRSFMAQVIDKQRPDPADNLSNVAVGILNIGRSFGSSLLRPLSAKVSAAKDTDYSNGWHVVGFQPSILNSKEPTLENLWTNADMAADILTANQGTEGDDNYPERAKACYGRDIVKKMATDAEGVDYEQWSVGPPIAGLSPTYQTLNGNDPDGKDHRCKDGDDDPNTVNDWERVRLFIKSSDVINGMACRIAAPNDPVGQQACAAIGNAANSGAE